MTLLAELRPLVRHLPHHPLRYIVFLAWFLRPERRFPFGEIHHDGAGLEYRDWFTALFRLCVKKHWHAVVRRKLEEVGMELVAAPDMRGFQRVRNGEFLEENGDFFAVWCRPEIKFKHGAAPDMPAPHCPSKARQMSALFTVGQGPQGPQVVALECSMAAEQETICASS